MQDTPLPDGMRIRFSNFDYYSTDSPKKKVLSVKSAERCRFWVLVMGKRKPRRRICHAFGAKQPCSARGSILVAHDEPALLGVEAAQARAIADGHRAAGVLPQDDLPQLLRRSLGPYSKFIVTLRGVGYRFETHGA